MQIRVKSSILTQKIIQKANPYCTKCLKKVLQPHKGIYCTSCKHLIHKNCCSFNIHDSRLETVCSSCTSEIFPFSNMNDELIRTNFNSNDQCLCGTKSPNSDIINILDRYNFLNSTELEKETPIASSIVGNTTDQFIDLKPNFKYIHEFHKLKQNKISKSTTSIIHINIGSLQANIDKLEILLTDLEFKFDVISL